MQLSEHFTLEEATISSTASRNDIANKPIKKQLAAMQASAASMELVRSTLGKPIHINSWFRSAELNVAIGGATTSAHMNGYAIDFISPTFGTPLQVAKAIAASGIKFDQLIYEGTWVHISFDPKMRGELMTAHFAPGKPTSYTIGIK